MNASSLIADAFFFLYILDRVGYSKTSLLLAIKLFTQAIVDFPTGVVADWIGHKRVISIAYVSHSLTYLFIGLLLFLHPANLFLYLTFIILLQSFSLAQESGALQSWFDNSYNQLELSQDSEKSIYSGVYGTTQIGATLVGILAVFLGGLIAQTWGREILFLIESMIMVLIAIIAYRGMSGFAEKEKPVLSLASYNKMLLDGIRVAISSTKVFFLSLMYISLMLFLTTWNFLFLFPIYYGYTGSDQAMANLRTIIFLFGFPITLYGVHLSKRLNPVKWLPILFVLFTTIWMGIYSVTFSLFPLPLSEDAASFNLSAIIFVVIAALYLRLLATLFNILYQKIVVDWIPDTNRNSYYSLIPTIGVLLNTGLIFLAGNYIDKTQSMLKTLLIFLFIPALFATIFSFFAFRGYTPPIEIQPETNVLDSQVSP